MEKEIELAIKNQDMSSITKTVKNYKKKYTQKCRNTYCPSIIKRIWISNSSYRKYGFTDDTCIKCFSVTLHPGSYEKFSIRFFDNPNFEGFNCTKK